MDDLIRKIDNAGFGVVKRLEMIWTLEDIVKLPEVEGARWFCECGQGNFSDQAKCVLCGTVK